MIYKRKIIIYDLFYLYLKYIKYYVKPIFK